MFRVHHNYKPGKEFEHTDIDIHIGDVITNMEYLDNGWAIGYNVNTRSAGIFPRRNVRPIQEDNSSIFPPRQPKYRPVFSEDRVEEYVQSDEIVDWLSNLNVEAFKKAYYQVVHTHRNQYRILKAVVGLVWGIIFGVLTFFGLHYALEYPLIAAAAMACAVGFILIIGLAFSTKCRAIVCLCLPTLTTKSGRFMLSAIAVAILVGGPVTNITNNASEMASVSSCAANLLANQTELIRQLAQEPYDQFVAGLKKTVEEVKNAVTTITNLLEPIQDAVADLRRVADIVSNELRRAQSRCLSSLDDGANDCKIKMLEASTKCNNFVNQVRESFECGGGIGQDPLSCGDSDGNAGAAHALCNSINDQLCSPVVDVRSVCDGLNVNLSDLSSVLAKLEQALSTDINLKDTIQGQVTTNDSLADLGNSIQKELEERTALITQIFTYVNWVLSLTVLLVVIQSYLYLRKYLRDDRHDNNYITKTFEAVDEKRMEKGKWSLLPLAPKEQKLVTDKSRWKMSTYERKTFCTGFLPVLLNIVGGVVVIGFDFLLYEAIILSNKYKGPKIEIRENVDLGVEVEDGGLLSTFLQDIIGNMRIQSDFDHTIDFNQCQPNGQKPGYVPIVGLGIVYMCMVMTVMLNAYALRLRHFLAGYFYEEREKDRVKFLHRKLLRRRVITLKELKDVLMVKRADLENKQVVKDFWDDVKAACMCSDKFTEECYLCETRDHTDQLNWCEHCNSYFCETCFNFTLNKVCPCNPDVSLSYDHVTDSDFEDDVQDRIVEQYYSYADRGQQVFDFHSSGEDLAADVELANMRSYNQSQHQQYGQQQNGGQQYGGRREIADLRKNRNSNFFQRQPSLL